MTDLKTPLVLVFYLDRELLQNKQIATQFTDSVDIMIKKRGYNVMAFFLPTDGEERIECLNPVEMKDDDTVRVNKILDEISTAFDVDQANKPNEG